MTSRRVVVIGAGIGGLAAALLLAARGLAVTVLERAAAPGGKMREVAAGGAMIDAGPTVLTMRLVFDELLAEAGARLDDHVRLTPATVLARHAWSAHERLDLFADTARSADAIAALAGPREAAGYRAFCARARRVYRALETSFIRAPNPTVLSLTRTVGLRGLASLLGVSPFSTLQRALEEHFRDPRLLQLFGRYATYCGASPFLATATLMLIAHVEQEGVWLVEGGMHLLARMLETLAARAGATFRYGTEVSGIVAQSGAARGVVLASGERIAADAVIANADVRALSAGLFGPAAQAAVPPQANVPRSLSALTWSMLAETADFPLQRHNVFFSRAYAAEFTDIFDRGRLPGEPTVYVCAQDRGVDGAAPGGPERLLCLVNAPARADIAEAEIEACEERTFALLARCGLAVRRRAEATVRTTPAGFAELFPASGGSLYGRALHGWTASFERPASRTKLPCLYLAGGSVHPGPGVPMAALSGRMAAAAALADLASTRRSHRVVTPGGMSTR